jgi:hypothetical protein
LPPYVADWNPNLEGKGETRGILIVLTILGFPPKVDSPENGFLHIEPFPKVTGFCGDGRAASQPYSFPDIENVFKMAGVPRGVFALMTADCNFIPFCDFFQVPTKPTNAR